MASNPLSALSALDGRYANKLTSVADAFCEAALIKWRVFVEIEYFFLLAKYGVVRKLTAAEKKILKSIPEQFELQAAQKVKDFEATTHHDVKAVEYYIREEFEKTTLKDCTSYIHFGITSEDVNNLAYRKMVQTGLEQDIFPKLHTLLKSLADLSEQHRALPMLARTHGQPAVPTTLGKEFSVFATRLLYCVQRLQKIQLTGKCNGAVGNFQAMMIAKPEVDWQRLSKELVANLGFSFSTTTTQINPPDDLISIFAELHHINGILLDLSQDTWRYISDNWLVQKGKENHVGSSTMPQKINPIEFENAEGNLTMANGMFEVFMRKLPVSRLQRDLSESTVLRNIGSTFGYSSLAYGSLQKGVLQLAPNKDVIHLALHENYAILLEAWQTWARTTGDSKAYETAAKLGKQKHISAAEWKEITKDADARIRDLTPETYVGLAREIAEEGVDEVRRFLST